MCLHSVGGEKAYEISVDPGLLSKYDTPLEVFRAISASKPHVGGDVVEKNGQAVCGARH